MLEISSIVTSPIDRVPTGALPDVPLWVLVALSKPLPPQSLMVGWKASLTLNALAGGEGSGGEASFG